MNSDFVPIGQASKILGVSIQTLRNWEKTGRLLPDFVSAGRTRRYSRRRLLSIAGFLCLAPYIVQSPDRRGL